MYPEVEQFIAALEAAEEKRLVAPAQREHDPETCGWCIFEAAERAALAALKASGDPLVAWIATNCRDYVDEATIVLRTLPASRDELDALARENSWCGVWSRFRDQAEQDGVLPAKERNEVTA